ncbi:hypothetical protein GCM10022254_09730 [Actinomadura meridiana]|uniref:ParB-like N-terminal domain-containing protein n=1 Tax=Actinomadura meridiana TaxID=559626 RepID=A0ABP8BU15_9ACTN
MSANKTTHRTIPVDRIDPDPDQPRKRFDPTKLNQLAASLKTVGLQQPVRVRYRPADRRYTLIMGERRWRAAQLADLTEIDAVVERGDKATFVQSVVENTARADMTPIEEAAAFKQLIDDGMTAEEVAEACAKSVPYITWRIDLLRLTPAAQEAVSKGHLSVGLAWEISELSADVQSRILGQWSRGEFTGTREAVEVAKACQQVEQQRVEGMFEVDEPSEEAKTEIRRRRDGLTSKFDRLAAAGEILAEFAATDPADLAQLLAGVHGGASAYQDRTEALYRVAGKAATNLRKAAAIAAAATMLADTEEDAEVAAEQ